jgi:hypothetical protein
VKTIDCQVFEDQLDALVAGELPEEGRRHLHIHAASCPDCAMLLKVQDHLAEPSLEELEAAVPEELLDDLWDRVEVRTGTPGPRLVPLLAAASVVLLLSTGFLLAELRGAKAEARELAGQLDALQGWLAGFPDHGGDLVRRTAELPRAGSPRARALDYALTGQERVRISTLRDLLAGLPEGEVLFTRSRLAELQRFASRPSPEMREVLGVLDSVLPKTQEATEVRAGDLADWLRASGLPADLDVPKSPLIQLFS